MTRRLRGPVALVGITFAMAGCTRSGSGGGGGSSDDTNPVPSETPSTMPWAANAGEVTRYADEEPFGPAASIAQDSTRIRKSPGGGDIVATLPAGADVVKLAAHGTDVLICFDEPMPGSRHLMGWVASSALEDPGKTPPSVDDGGAPPPEPPPPHGGRHHHRKHKGRHP